MSLTEIRSGVELPVERHALTLQTADGQQLVAELALPVGKPPKATLICLHPLPTHGGFMDSHVMRKASNRLPYLADVAVLRFNTRGTSSPHGTSTGAFDGGVAERYDLEAAVAYAVAAGLQNRWLLGWSFGTELALKYGANQDVMGAILMSPPLHRATQQDLEVWNHNDKRVVGIIPEFDDYLVPSDAAVGFAVMRKFEQVNIDGGKHLWVGEDQVRQVLNEIVKVAAPWAYPLPNEVELPDAV